MRRDGQTKTASFVVAAHAMPPAKVPDVIYPGVDYVVDPRLPAIENVRAVIRDGEREIASATESVIRLRVAARDTGRTLTFERTVDGVRDGAPEAIQVRNFPAPTIRSVNRGSDSRTKVVVVQFYSGDRSVNRPRLRILDGNATDVKRLAGNLRASSSERPTVSWLETFEVSQCAVGRGQLMRPLALFAVARNIRTMFRTRGTESMFARAVAASHEEQEPMLFWCQCRLHCCLARI